MKVGGQVSQRLVHHSSCYVKAIRRPLYGEPGCAGTGIAAANPPPVPSCPAPDSDRRHLQGKRSGLRKVAPGRHGKA